MVSFIISKTLSCISVLANSLSLGNASLAGVPILPSVTAANDRVSLFSLSSNFIAGLIAGFPILAKPSAAAIRT